MLINAPGQIRSCRSGGGEEGSAVVGFVMVSILVLAIFAGLWQLAFTQYVKNILTDAAIQGAHVAAREGADLTAGVAQTEKVITAALSARFAGGVSARWIGHGPLPVSSAAASGTTGSENGAASLPIVAVVVSAPVPIFGPYGLGWEFHVTGRALQEQSRQS